MHSTLMWPMAYVLNILFQYLGCRSTKNLSLMLYISSPLETHIDSYE